MSSCVFQNTRMGLIVVLVAMIGYVSEVHAQPEESGNVSGDKPKSEIEIVMESYEYSPSEVMVKVGIPFTLVLKNESFLVPHNFILDDPEGNRVLERDVSSGESQSVTLTLTQSGTYRFYCDKQLLFFPSHEEQGMTGHLVVQE